MEAARCVYDVISARRINSGGNFTDTRQQSSFLLLRGEQQQLSRSQSSQVQLPQQIRAISTIASFHSTNHFVQQSPPPAPAGQCPELEDCGLETTAVKRGCISTKAAQVSGDTGGWGTSVDGVNIYIWGLQNETILLSCVFPVCPRPGAEPGGGGCQEHCFLLPPTPPTPRLPTCPNPHLQVKGAFLCKMRAAAAAPCRHLGAAAVTWFIRSDEGIECVTAKAAFIVERLLLWVVLPGSAPCSYPLS
ncbi:uncharacterized protein LOC119778461 [Cyprinodon tularosa]|uniref:uncharacterized protein LOC119778461 n=1 Tax=Cyprinodon tularosa TaxID=77115 RepID=UPI0018E1ED0A|nr:uncharacterized protein LOC119778461 [Cyprinodon tularosa]